MFAIKWNCPRWGSNSQPPHLSSTYTAYKYSALTDCATGAIMPTDRTVLTIDNNKNHTCFMEQDNTEINNTQTVLEKQIIPGGIRTHGLWIRSPTRYPLRYRDLIYLIFVVEWNRCIYQLFWHKRDLRKQVVGAAKIVSLYPCRDSNPGPLD